jgi:hypothetical protein
LLDEDTQKFTGTLSSDGVLLVVETFLDSGGETKVEESSRSFEFDEID